VLRYTTSSGAFHSIVMASMMEALSPNPPIVNHRWFAALYDLFEGIDKKWAERTRRAVAGGATGVVLEIGCGTRFNLNYYDWPKVTSLDATDPDPNMLRRAGARQQKLALDAQAKVKLHQVPAEVLTFPDEHFDTVVSPLVLCTVSRPDQAISEVRRVLKPGGQFRLAEHVAASGFTGGFQKAIQPVYGWVAAGCQLHRHTEQALLDAGLRLEVEDRHKMAPFAPAFQGVAYR